MDKKINRKLLILGGLIILALVLSSLAPRLLGDSLTKVNLGQALQGPNSSEWFETDALGRSGSSDLPRASVPNHSLLLGSCKA